VVVSTALLTVGLMIVASIVTTGQLLARAVDLRLQYWAQAQVEFRARAANVETARAEALRAVDDIAERRIQEIRARS
jgi:hypothetical protein